MTDHQEELPFFQQLCQEVAEARHLHIIEVQKELQLQNGAFEKVNYPAMINQVRKYIKKMFRHRKDYPDDYDFVKGVAVREISLRMHQLEGQLKNTFSSILMKEYGDRIHNLNQKIKDIYQEVMCVLIQDKIHKRPVGEIRVSGEWLIGLTAALSSFLIGIGRNKIKEIQRTAPRRLNQEEQYKIMRTTEFNIGREVYLKLLKKAIDRACNPVEKEALRLFYFELKSHKEIAEQLGLASDNVSRVYLTRARKKLEPVLEELFKEVDIEELLISKIAFEQFWEIEELGEEEE